MDDSDGNWRTTAWLNSAVVEEIDVLFDPSRLSDVEVSLYTARLE
ncbi:hypothetical Protein YC6258_01866 [Gynuella sunshinyii YC6258]|uniref:Uncharacterized protein n=1 Tax=Gynuella sunshinyii YC6258 TaxID=1445510 RepID=A0A0C5V309_9GAMM|nr:hypothetical Protein YC6258_01866 [Gynuella sunshinyii YC6258]